MKSKFIKYDRWTARNNPEMIIGEYDRLINEIENNFRDVLKKRKHPILFDVVGEREKDVLDELNKVCANAKEMIKNIKDGKYSGSKVRIELFFNYDEAKKITDWIEEREPYIREAIQKRDLLIEEQKQFRKEYLK